MYYEINIAKKVKGGGYKHLFATAERSITTEKELREIYPELKKAFPEPEYSISVSYQTKKGYHVDMDEFMSAKKN